MGILIRNNIINQKGNPAWYEDALAARPIANLQGRMFVDTDNPSTGIYRDTGSSWVNVADPGAGTTGTLQQVTTNGSSTNVGISVSANGIGIGTAIPGANILDIHGTTGVLAQLENTGAQNSLLSFRNQGAGVWSIGNGYNAGANDFIVYDAVSFVNRLTIKSTGQTFIGSDTTSSGLFVVNSSTSDNHIVVLGANAPSVRIRNAGTSPTLNVGLGISTATNNFIQGSVSGNFCIFNASTTASPILFGVYDSGAGNTQEAARISAARNFLVGGSTDSGQKLQITGTAFISSSVTANNYFLTGMSSGNGALYFYSSGNKVTVANYNANGVVAIETNGGTLAATFDSSQNLLIGTTINNSSRQIHTSGNGVGFFDAANTRGIIIVPNTTGGVNQIISDYAGGTYLPIAISSRGQNQDFYLNTNGNLCIGTTTDNGDKLQINGSISIGNSVAAGIAVASTHKVSILIGGVQYYLLASNI